MKTLQEVVKMLEILPMIGRHLKGKFEPDIGFHIKKSELKALMEIKKKPHQSMKYYIRLVEIESGSFTYLADKLEQKGFVKRVPSKDDKRKTVLELTDIGEEVTDKLDTQFKEHISKQLECLNKEDFTDIKKATNILKKILKKMETN